MYIELTKEEIEHIEDIRNKYADKSAELSKKMKAENLTPEEEKKIFFDYYILKTKIDDQIDAYMDKIQRDRIRKIKGGTAGIIENAKEQTPQILEHLFFSMKKDYQAATPAFLEEIGMGTRKGDNFYLRAQYAEDCIKDELRLHFKALEKDEDAIIDLLTFIREMVKNSPYTTPKKEDPGEIPGQLSVFDYIPQNTKKDHKQSPKKKAEELGAVTDLGGFLVSISSKKYQFAFTEKVNKYAYMKNGGPHFIQSLMKEAIPEQGILEEYITEEHKKTLTQNTKEKPIDTFLVSAFYSAVMASTKDKSDEVKDSKDPTNKYTRVYLPSFCHELGIRLNTLDEETAAKRNIKIYQTDNTPKGKKVEVVDGAKNNNDFWARLSEVENYIGVLNESGYVQFVNIAAYDIDTQILYLDFPYFNFLTKQIMEDADRAVKSKKDKSKILYEKNYLNKLMHSSAANNRNKTGVAIAKLLIDGLLQRGTTPDAKLLHNRKKNYGEDEKHIITYTITCQKIVNEIPAFKYRLENMKSTEKGRDKKTKKEKTRSEKQRSILTQQNRALKDAFTVAYKILATQTDLYKYFKNVKVIKVIPTMRQLKTTDVIITHTGADPNYRKI